MIDFRVFESRVSHGWKLLNLEVPGSVKNINHFHVTYVLCEILLVWQFFADKAVPLTVCLLVHLANLLLGMSDKAKAMDANSKNAAVKAYWVIEAFLLLYGCATDWRLFLLHFATSHIVPLTLFGLQAELLCAIFFQSNSARAFREITWIFCRGTTFIMYIDLVLLLASQPGIWLPVKVVFGALYLAVAMPLMAEFEDAEENLFEFAFKMLN